MKITLMVACLLPSLALADTLPYSVFQARERMEQEPEYYERADQFCAEKRVGSPCVIPGNPFEGGGNGTCRTSPSSSGAIESRCTLTYRPTVLDSLPDGSYRAPELMCENGKLKKTYESTNSDGIISCNTVNITSDKYCNGKSANDSCVANVNYGTSTAAYQGICREKEDIRRIYSYGYITLKRTILTCSPENPVIINTQESSPPSWLRRLFE